MLSGWRFRAELTGDQLLLAQTTADACRVVYNTGLQQRRAYRKRGSSIGYAQQCKELTKAKAEHTWLREAPAVCLQQALRDLDRNCAQHGTWKVDWRSQRRWEPSLRFADPKQIKVERLNHRGARVWLNCFGWVRFRLSKGRDIAAVTLRSVTLRLEHGRWQVSLLVEDGRSTPACHELAGTAVGIDRGVTVAVATSDGDLHDRAFVTPTETRRAKRLARQISRRAKGSVNRGKAKEKYARLRATEAHRREDFVKQLACVVTEANELVVLEDLRTHNMTRRPKPRADPADPGKFLPNGRASKAGLNQAILGKGWSLFELALTSAARRTGSAVVKVCAAYTSQRCPECGWVDPKSRESQAVFRCVHCLHYGHADIGAARNILAAGLADRLNACGGDPPPSGSGYAMKQEPAGNREELLLCVVQYGTESPRLSCGEDDVK